MRTFGFCSFLCIASVALAMSVPAYAGGQSRSAAVILPADPQVDLLAVLPPEEPGGAGVREGCGTEECEVLGGFVSQYTFANRFRGNKFHLEYAGDLLEFSMELCIYNEMDLWFSVFEYDEISGKFCRVWIDPDSMNGDVVVEDVGPGCGFYSSGPLDGVTLDAGSTYVLGVAWGAPSVTYAWDLLPNPRDFSHGHALGAVSTNTPGSGPPVDPADDCLSLGHSYVGLWSMEVCLGLDPGACCLPNGTCAYINLGECVAAGGEFAAPLFTCDDVEACPLIQGACCIGGGCQDRNRYRCECEGGEWSGEGTFCSGDPDPCIPNGACCLECGCEDQQTEAECLSSGGVYRGDETDCASISIPCTAGACCTGTDCSFLDSYQECLDSGGSYAGFGTTCESDPCDPTGACCTDECTDAISEAQCVGEGGVYRGDWTGCSALSPGCGLGACCVADSGCFEGLSETICEQLEGTFQGEGTACDSLESSCPGSCCSDVGCLNGWSPEDCADAPGGVFLEYDVACTDEPDCDAITGLMCCLPLGTCVLVETGDLCELSLGGVLDASCSDQTCVAPSVGACCLADDICAEVTEIACTAVGVYQGDDTFCETGLCFVADGACCIDYECTVLSCSDCDSAGGTYHGGSTSCDGDPCVDGSGACCRADGSCDDVAAVGDCSEADETFFSEVSCSSDPCPAMGACCVGETCTATTEAACIDAAGSYQGDDIPCDPDLCEPIAITESNPASDSIDARQPSDVNDCGILFGWDSIDITFDGDASGVVGADFAVSLDPAGVPPSIIAVTYPSGDTVSVQLDGAIPTGHWTIFTHLASDTSARIGYLPSDVNSDGTSGTIDILDMIDFLNGVPGLEFPEWSTDCDRSGATNSADILCVIDLLNGAGCFDPWIGETLP